jgi:uncharacterized membrane protein (UPF0127 family)
MTRKQIFNRFHVWAFVPWLTFWSQGGLNIHDQTWLNVAVSKHANNCQSLVAKLKAKVAHSNESRTKGLGGRTTPLTANEGMLFIFDAPETVRFWMKDTLIPLDIHYFNEKGILTNSAKMPVERDPAHPKKIYSSAAPAMTALEVAPGAISKVTPGSATLCIDTISQ